MTAAFTVLIPHLRNPGNDRALELAVSCLLANTEHDFHLLIDAVHGGNLFQTVNRMFRRAATDCVVFWNSDMFAAPGWDTPMLDLWRPDRYTTIVTNVVVEPRAIGVHPENYERDFGRRPETFQREAFEAWATSSAAVVPDGVGWKTPYMMSRSAFLSRGGFIETPIEDTDADGFTGADVLFWNAWLADGNEIVRAKSFVYHLQRWSMVHEQEHEKRGVSS